VKRALLRRLGVGGVAHTHVSIGSYLLSLRMDFDARY